MRELACSLTSSSSIFFGLNPFSCPSTKSTLRYEYGVRHFVYTAHAFLRSGYYHYSNNKKKKKIGNLRDIKVRASGRESPYEVLGLPPSASTKDIKRAYRRLALKYHPDVNKEAGAEEKFMRIKHAYNTLLASKSRVKYDAGNQGSDFSYSASGRSQTKTRETEEEFYGFEDFFRDLQEEYRNWEATAAAQGKPKSLWEELAEIGEEFVEFLEKELNVTDGEAVENNGERSSKEYETKKTANNDSKDKSIDDNIDEIEAALAQLKRELGL